MIDDDPKIVVLAELAKSCIVIIFLDFFTNEMRYSKRRSGQQIGRYVDGH